MVADQSITVVSGIPRSGTSLMMQMLEAAGLKIFSDGVRKQDENNPRGYYEFEKVKSIARDASWLADARGKVIKVIAQLVRHLPGDLNYRIIMMDRDINEVMDSQTKMIDRLGGDAPAIDPNVLARTFEKHRDQAIDYIAGSNDMELLLVNYAGLIADPRQEVNRIIEYLGLDNALADAMASCVDLSLYRSRIA